MNSKFEKNSFSNFSHFFFLLALIRLLWRIIHSIPSNFTYQTKKQIRLFYMDNLCHIQFFFLNEQHTAWKQRRKRYNSRAIYKDLDSLLVYCGLANIQRSCMNKDVEYCIWYNQKFIAGSIAFKRKWHQ